MERLREGARAALESGAPATAADLLERALAEPPPAEARVEVLRSTARAELLAGRALARQRLEEAIRSTEGRLQAEIASELAHTYATLFRWADAVEVLERTLSSLGKTHEPLATHLQSQLIAAGLQEARVAPRALQAMKRMSRRRLSGSHAASLALAEGMVAILTGQPADEAARPLERALTSLGGPIESWDMLAALWWCLLAAERFDLVAAAVESARKQADRSGRGRGLCAWTAICGDGPGGCSSGQRAAR